MQFVQAAHKSRSPGLGVTYFRQVGSCLKGPDIKSISDSSPLPLKCYQPERGAFINSHRDGTKEAGSVRLISEFTEASVW